MQSAMNRGRDVSEGSIARDCSIRTLCYDARMELIVLGSGTAAPSLRRAPPGYLLRIGADRVVLDTGPGTLRRLLEAGVTHDQVTHLFYTHNHLDHTGEL